MQLSGESTHPYSPSSLCMHSGETHTTCCISVATLDLFVVLVPPVEDTHAFVLAVVEATATRC